jgi:hypothetical protein
MANSTNTKRSTPTTIPTVEVFGDELLGMPREGDAGVGVDVKSEDDAIEAVVLDAIEAVVLGGRVYVCPEGKE